MKSAFFADNTIYNKRKPVQFENICRQHFNIVQMMICVTDGIENIVGKGENACYQHFLLSPQCFPVASFTG